MPSFDCGGGRCGEFSCASCCDDETIREYWSLFQTGAAKSDAEARSIMTSRINDREALARSAPTLRADLARVTAERDALRAEVEAMRAVVEACEHCPIYRPDFEPLADAFDALDALRARKVGG